MHIMRGSRNRFLQSQLERAFTVRSPSGTLLPFLGEGSPTKIDHRKKGTLFLTSLLEDLDCLRPLHGSYHSLK